MGNHGNLERKIQNQKKSRNNHKKSWRFGERANFKKIKK